MRDYMLGNGGVIHRHLAIAMGMAPRTIDRRVGDGSLIRVGYGILGLPGILLIEKSTLAAATSALGGVVSHESAARLHGITGLHPDRIAISVPVRCTHDFDGVEVHQLTDLMPEHVREVDGLPTTVPARTIVDLAAVMGQGKLADVADQIVRLKKCTYEDLSSMLESLARSGKPGVRRLRSVLEPRLGGAYAIDSTLETLVLELVLRAGLPPPNSQHRPKWLKHMNGRVDFAYPDHQLVIEGDSLKYHGAPDLFQKDRERDNFAQVAGWRVLRFTWYDITQRPDHVVHMIRTALGNSPRR